MRKKIIIRTRTRRNTDHFSLKKAFKKVGNVVKDTVKLGAAPVKLAVSSVTGKPVKTTYSTKLGGAIAKVHDTGSKTLTSTVKGFADTVTGGLATKAANVFRKPEFKEKAFAYNEMKNTGVAGPSFGKVLDKVAVIMPTAGAAIGGVAGGVLAGKKALSLGKKQSSDNMKQSSIEIGPNVLTGETPIQSGNYGMGYNPDRPAPDISLTGVPPGGFNTGTPNTLTASGFGLGSLSPISIGIAVVAIILLVLAVKNKSAA